MRLLKNKKLLGIKITIEQRDTIDETNSIIDTAKDIASKETTSPFKIQIVY